MLIGEETGEQYLLATTDRQFTRPGYVPKGVASAQKIPKFAIFPEENAVVCFTGNVWMFQNTMYEVAYGDKRHGSLYRRTCDSLKEKFEEIVKLYKPVERHDSLVTTLFLGMPDQDGFQIRRLGVESSGELRISHPDAFAPVGAPYMGPINDLFAITKRPMLAEALEASVESQRLAADSEPDIVSKDFDTILLREQRLPALLVLGRRKDKVRINRVDEIDSITFYSG
jgi:hypothetical protein